MRLPNGGKEATFWGPILSCLDDQKISIPYLPNSQQGRHLVIGNVQDLSTLLLDRFNQFNGSTVTFAPPLLVLQPQLLFYIPWSARFVDDIG